MPTHLPSFRRGCKYFSLFRPSIFHNIFKVNCHEKSLPQYYVSGSIRNISASSALAYRLLWVSLFLASTLLGQFRGPLSGPVRPDALPRLLMRLHSEYGDKPIVITENGAGFGPNDEVMADSGVRDPLRADYIRRHIDAVLRARRDGADVRGYMERCLFDNFEWFRGYDTRFGMVHVDFATQKRTPKSSFHAYHDIIRAFQAQAAA